MSEHGNSAPLTPLQRAYLAARDGAAPLGATGMLDVRVWESDVDADRLREVVASLVARHEALRLRIDAAAGTQSVAPEADVLRVVDLHGRGDDAFIDLLAGLRTAPRPLDALVEVVHVRRDDRDAVVLCSDALALDGQGLARVISEARRLLADPTLSLPPAPTGLLDALRAFPAGADADRAQRAADDLPAAPRLPWRAALDGLGPIRTERTSRVVDAAIWRRAVLAGGAAGLSAHSVAAGAIGDELAARSGGPVRLSVPTAGGGEDAPVGPFAGFVVVGAGADPADAVSSARVLQAELFARLDGPDGPAVATALARRDRTAVACPVVVTNGLAWPATPAPVAAWTSTPQVVLDIRLGESDGALVLTADVAVDALALETADEILDAVSRRLDAVGRPRPAARASSLLSGAKRARMDALLKARGIATAAAPTSVDEVVASPSEERMWLLHELDPYAATGAVALAVRFDGDVDADRLATALRRTIEDFPALRTVWDAVEGGVRPRELSADAVHVERIALAPDEVRAYVVGRARVAFDLATEAPLRVSLIDTGSGDTRDRGTAAGTTGAGTSGEAHTDARDTGADDAHRPGLVLGIVGHHIALDDASWHPFFARLSAHYDGDAPAIDRGAYRRFAAEKVRWLRGTGSAPVLERWRAVLDGAVPLTLPAAWRRSMAEPTPVGAEAHGIRRLRAELPRLAEAGARTGAGGLHTLAVAAAAVLTAATGRTDGVIDLPVLDVEGMGAHAVGARGNLVPLRLGVRGDDTVASLTARTVEAVRAATAGGVVPIELIRRTQPALRERAGFLLVGVGDVLGSARIGGAAAREIELPPLATEPGITIALREGATPALEVTWSSDVSETAARTVLDALCTAVEALATAEGDEPAGRLLRDVMLLRPASVATGVVDASAPVRTATVSADAELTERADAVLEAFRGALEAFDLGPDDDFFDAGGHSLLATRVIATLRARGIDGLRIGDFFAHPTARALGAVAGEPVTARSGAARADAPAPPGTPRSVETEESGAATRADAVALLPQQRGIWFLDRFDDGGLGYAIPYVLRFTSAPDAAALRAAVRDVLVRHEGLRVLVDVVDGTPRQRVVPTHRLDDLAWWSTDAEDLRRGFDLDREIGVRAVHTDDGRSLGLLLHHLVADEWSTGILLRDLATAYDARAAGRAPAWPTPAPSPLDLVTERADTDASLAFWRARLADAPAGLPLAADRAPDPLAPADGGWHAFTIADGAAAGLRGVARRTRSSLFVVLEAAVVATLARLGESDDILVAVPVAGRDERTAEMVGMLANTVVLRHRVPADTSLDALVVSARETLVDALEHETVPFENVVLAVGPDRSTGLSPLATTMVQLHSGGELRGTLPHPGGEIAYEIAEPERTHAKFELSFEFIDDAEGLRGGIAFRTALFDSRTVARLAERLLAVIGALADSDETATLADLPIPRGEARPTESNAPDAEPVRSSGAGAAAGSVPAAAGAGNDPDIDTLNAVLACAAEALGIPDPSPEASFFALGGDSISSIAFVARLRERGLAAAPRQVFAHPVLVELARALRPAETAATATESTPLSASGLSPELLAALVGDPR